MEVKFNKKVVMFLIANIVVSDIIGMASQEWVSVKSGLCSSAETIALRHRTYLILYDVLIKSDGA
ncbi:hypothetical protein [Sulfuracidifex tepidarius]|uniref:Uncharacterized protein n=1 Tax=Sulfuracidifex tepidarius TaxID=1294262 RepID=A0A510DTN3_9CREN|nr:hypothetical protein [Sulfuracidifex tepidarius]BBG23418.1 hypothetical protein IC006_0702 [Sulfuracidifex tepidarius]BBG26171.1 hypothetical protein IC007_0676 [Sulfuracidifex tepidarius]